MLKRVSVELWFVRSTKSIRNYELRITCKRLIEVLCEAQKCRGNPRDCPIIFNRLIAEMDKGRTQL